MNMELLIVQPRVLMDHMEIPAFSQALRFVNDYKTVCRSRLVVVSYAVKKVKVTSSIAKMTSTVSHLHVATVFQSSL